MATCNDCHFWHEADDEIEPYDQARPINLIGNHYLQPDHGVCHGLPPTPMDNHAGGIYFVRYRSSRNMPACAFFRERR